MQAFLDPAPIIDRPLGLCCVMSSTLVGLRPEAISVEVACSRGPAFFQLVGLAQAPVREARVRVSSALSRLGVLLEEWAITVNLAPADLRKKDAALDLPIALGVLGALGLFSSQALLSCAVLGELSLDGRLQPIRGVLPLLVGARSCGVQSAIVPQANAREAGLVRGVDIHVANSLEAILDHLKGGRPLPLAPTTEFNPQTAGVSLNMSEVRGQTNTRRALEIAAAGGHNVLMIGPPGAGKTMLARRMPSILPPLQYDEALECTAVHSVAGLIDPQVGVLETRPFRAPHHSVTEQGLVGGGSNPRPGEVSLAHNGVLFLDELPEFRRGVLESLRQPLEDGEVCISRARAQATFPARPIVIGAMNPCPCGYYGHPTRQCVCSQKQRERYRARISGPLLDRLDVHACLPPVEITALTRPEPGEDSKTVRERVLLARQTQLGRFRDGTTHVRTNAELGGGDFDQVLSPTTRGMTLLERATHQFGLSARAFGKVLRVARTIADLEGVPRVNDVHIAEALQGRLSEREMG
jgi:magnesium chelatase family protein